MIYTCRRTALGLVGEDGLDSGVEEAGEFEGEGKAGVVFSGLDGVDGLAGDLEFLGEVGLGPVSFGAEDAEAVVHLYLALRNGVETAAKNQKSGYTR